MFLCIVTLVSKPQKATFSTYSLKCAKPSFGLQNLCQKYTLEGIQFSYII